MGVFNIFSKLNINEGVKKFRQTPIVKKESELSLLDKASQEMKALGFTSIEEYLAYKAK